MDIGGLSLYNLISGKLLATLSSKLCILGTGLSSSSLSTHLAIAPMVGTLAAAKGDTASWAKTFKQNKQIVFVVTASTAETTLVQTQLNLSSIVSTHTVIDHSVNNTKKQRAKNYSEGGIFVIGVMKMVLDVLEELVVPSKVMRVILLNVYEVGENHPLSLAINILQRFNEELQTIAVVNDPFKLQYKDTLADFMRNLYLKDCQFWPVFREEICEYFKSVEAKPDGEKIEEKKEGQVNIAADVGDLLLETKYRTHKHQG